jgi:hypothetical protein
MQILKGAAKIVLLLGNSSGVSEPVDSLRNSENSRGNPHLSSKLNYLSSNLSPYANG